MLTSHVHTTTRSHFGSSTKGAPRSRARFRHLLCCAFSFLEVLRESWGHHCLATDSIKRTLRENPLVTAASEYSWGSSRSEGASDTSVNSADLEWHTVIAYYYSWRKDFEGKKILVQTREKELPGPVAPGYCGVCRKDIRIRCYLVPAPYPHRTNYHTRFGRSYIAVCTSCRATQLRRLDRSEQDNHNEQEWVRGLLDRSPDNSQP